MNVCKVASRIRLPLPVYGLQMSRYLPPYLQPYKWFYVNEL